MELFEIKTAERIEERKDYPSAKQYFDSLDCAAELYVIREPEGEAELIDSKPRVIRRERFIQYPARFATIGVLALMSCGCQPVTVHEQNQMFLFLTAFFFAFMAGYITARKIYKGVITEKEMELIQLSLKDGRNFKEQIDELKKENSKLKRLHHIWDKVFFSAGKG